MKTTFNTIILVLLLLAGLAARAAGGDFEKVLADKKYDIDKNALLIIEHKYGMVTCKNWDQQAIAVKITAEVEASSREAAEKIFARIDFDLNGNRSKVGIESRNNDKLFSGNRNNLTIRVEVMMPETVRLNVHNQFGNCYIGKVSGATEIQIEYGSLEIDALKNEQNQVEIDFGGGRISYIHGGEVEVSYSPLQMDEANNISVESAYSDVKIGKATLLEIESEGGNVQIGSVGEAVLEAKFSDCTIASLRHTLRAESEYGALLVSEVSSEFEQIEIENSFGSARLIFSSDASFSLEAEVELGSIEFPESRFTFLQRKISTTSSSYIGTTGSDPHKAAVTIESAYGSVTLGFK
jgi:hypothetical protein